MSKATIKEISATSRASVKINDSFYTVEYGEVRSLPNNLTEQEVIDERDELWTAVNYECDEQIKEIINAFGSKKR